MEDPRHASALWYVLVNVLVVTWAQLKPGPIVRINPEELHIDDPEYYDEIYGSTTKKRDKYGPWASTSATPGATFTTLGHDHHRLRRGALNPFFSVKAVVELEPVVKAKVDILARRFELAKKTGEVLRADAAFMALTMDIICQYAFASDDNMLAEDDFNVAWKELLIGAFEVGPLLRQFPSIVSIMSYVPDYMMKAMNPSLGLMLKWKAGVRRRVEPILNRTETAADIENAPHRSIFHELRDSNLPPSEKTIDRLCDEAQIFTGAGSETTAKVLTTALFYLLDDKQMFMSLKKELGDERAELNTWSKLSQLPYLVRTLSVLITSLS